MATAPASWSSTPAPRPWGGVSWLEASSASGVANARRRGSTSIFVDTRGLRELRRDLLEASEDIYLECKAELRLIAEDVRDVAVQTALGFSTRIPPTIRVRGTAGLNVFVTAGGPNAPHALPIENRGAGKVKHPVFGNMNDWTDLNSPPAYLHPALEARRPEIDARIEAALNRAVKRAVERG